MLPLLIRRAFGQLYAEDDREDLVEAMRAANPAVMQDAMLAIMETYWIVRLQSCNRLNVQLGVTPTAIPLNTLIPRGTMNRGRLQTVVTGSHRRGHLSTTEPKLYNSSCWRKVCQGTSTSTSVGDTCCTYH